MPPSDVLLENLQTGICHTLEQHRMFLPFLTAWEACKDVGARLEGAEAAIQDRSREVSSLVVHMLWRGDIIIIPNLTS